MCYSIKKAILITALGTDCCTMYQLGRYVASLVTEMTLHLCHAYRNISAKFHHPYLPILCSQMNILLTFAAI